MQRLGAAMRQMAAHFCRKHFELASSQPASPAGSGGPPSSESSSESLQPECRDDGDVAAVPSAATASSMEVLKPRDISACSVQVLGLLCCPSVLLVSEQRE